MTGMEVVGEDTDEVEEAEVEQDVAEAEEGGLKGPAGTGSHRASDLGF